MEKLSTMNACYEGRIDKSGESIFISAPAKINLFLKITGKRTDGYHDIHSWFQTIDLNDHLEIRITSSSDITIEVNKEDIPTGPDNLVYQAAEKIQRISDRDIGFDIKLYKQIPSGAGLGGGSSDAAAFIKAADKLLNLGLSRQIKSEIGLEIGSDIPFFFSRGQAEVTGKGENVKEIALPTDYRVGLVTPRFEIRASEAYRKFNLDLTDSLQDINLLCCHQIEDLIDVMSGLPNDLEKLLFESYPILGEIQKVLSKSGADIVRLTGSGPTVYALFRREGLIAEQFLKLFEGGSWDLNIAGPVILPA
ncbi:MAG: 4-(cytidine 5'-diphospho)-2-C-methyl-D-erythritol kinase [FCB group bacterium]|nr:4-(cytidine 5'-diphospho)-2-C-methyl-D-erythritol kinase [FCB group bacterium]